MSGQFFILVPGAIDKISVLEIRISNLRHLQVLPVSECPLFNRVVFVLCRDAHNDLVRTIYSRVLISVRKDD